MKEVKTQRGDGGKDLLPCPKCKDGKMKISVNTGGGSGFTSLDIQCIYCEGKGKITEVESARIKRMDDSWCRCSEPGEAIYYELPSGSHGYNCSKCGKIQQTG